MSQKIIANILSFISLQGAENLTIEASPGNTSLNCRFSEEELNIVIPKKLEQEFLSVLRRILNLAPGELVDGRLLQIRHPKYSLSFHLTVRPDRVGEKISLNFLHNQTQLWRLNQLGLSADDLKTIKQLGTRPGLIAITSLANQGKSATLNALIQEYNNPATDIYCLRINDSYPPIAGINYLSPQASNWDRLLQHDSDMIFADDADSPIILEKAVRAANSGRRVLVAFTAGSLKEAKEKIASAAQNSGLKNSNLKAITHQSLDEWRIPNRKNSLRKRLKIGRFKIWLA